MFRIVRFGRGDWRICCGDFCIPDLYFKSRKEALAYVWSK